MAFKDIQFPVGISYGATGGPGWLTDIVTLQSGFEQRNQLLAQSRGSWEVSHAARLPAAYGPLRAFFNAVRGRTYGFRFKDWTDYTVALADGVFIDIDATHKQLAKRYTFGAESFDRKIQKPVVGSVSFSGGTGLSLDYTTGIVTYSSAPLAWSGEFDVPCRFDTDEMRAESITKSANQLVIGWSSIPVREIRV